MKYCLPNTIFHFSKYAKLSKLLHSHFSTAVPFEKIHSIKFTPVDDFQITGFIGKGSTSRVYQGYNIINQKQVIIKLFKHNRDQPKIFHQFRVNNIISQCHHVIPLIGIVRDPGCTAYGLIFANLHGIPLNLLAGKVQFGDGIRYMHNVLQALTCCHKNGIVHRDLKNSNILITKSGAKLFDFGLAKIQRQDDFKVTRFGTKCYYTPQVIFNLPYYTRKIDIWCCGLIMAEVLSQKKPLMPYTSDQVTAKQIVHFSGYNQQIVNNRNLKLMNRVNFKKLLQGRYSDKKIIEQAGEIIEMMMNIDPNQRPQASEILKMDVFRNLQRIR